MSTASTLYSTKVNNKCRSIEMTNTGTKRTEVKNTNITILKSTTNTTVPKLITIITVLKSKLRSPK